MMPRLTLRSRLRFTLVLAVAALAPAAAQASTPNSAFADEVYGRINTERRNKGVGNLVRVRAAELAAQLHAMDMANREYMAHYTQNGTVVPDPQGYPNIQFTSGMSPADRLRRCGFSAAGEGWGENVGYNWGYESGSPADIVRRWMESPSHKENVLEGDFRGTGIGCAVSASGKVYYAQVFVASPGGFAGISSNAQLWSNNPPQPGPDGTAPGSWSGLSLSGKALRISVRDTGSGLAPATALYRTSTNGGATWSAWQTASCSGATGTTATQQLTTPSLSLPAGTSSRVQFQVRDVAGNTGTSPAYTLPSKPKKKARGKGR